MLWCYRQLSVLMSDHGATAKITDMPVLSNFKISNVDLKITLNLVAVARLHILNMSARGDFGA